MKKKETTLAPFFVASDGENFRVFAASDFNLLGRYIHDKDIRLRDLESPVYCATREMADQVCDTLNEDAERRRGGL